VGSIPAGGAKKKKTCMKHILESQQFDKQTIEKIFLIADSFAQKGKLSLQGKIMIALFYEPSTRTRFSFESAMIRLDGHVIHTEHAEKFSSVIKGETLEDTIRVIGNYADVIVLRHPEAGASQRAAKVSSVPIINAGDGVGQHPTQALLDLYTIQKELGKIESINIAMVGDLKNGRTVRSLSYLLGKYKNIVISFVSPKELRIGEDIKMYLNKHRVSYMETENLHEVLSQTDVVYQTRIQKERFINEDEYQKLKGHYKIDKETVSHMRESAILMHPLPRVDEISPDVDQSPKAVYFKQTHYGLLIRMALLDILLS
jgi:aspartate carbamoyltransferase catalytic subunit